MAQRIVVDPITRIEGHLRIEAEIKDGVIVDAYSSGTMVRGIELILKGRDPRDAWAFTERVCGVCTTVHALASVRTVENALGITVPPNADVIRNLMFCAQYMQDHVVHFYHLHALDWVVWSLPSRPILLPPRSWLKVFRAGPTARPGIFLMFKNELKNSWIAANWVFSPTDTGDIQVINFLPKPT